MKTRFTPRCVPLATALFVCAAVWLPQTALSGGKPYKTYRVTGEEEPREKKPSKKIRNRNGSYSSRNNHSVRIYPDAIKREMHVVAKENDGKEVEFFVFDLQGTLVQNYKLNPKDHIRLSNMKRGKYRYHVFCGDLETAAGEFEIR
jgi:hypothetical protein